MSTFYTTPESSVVHERANPFKLSICVGKGYPLPLYLFIVAVRGNLGMKDKAKQRNTKYSDFFKKISK